MGVISKIGGWGAAVLIVGGLSPAIPAQAAPMAPAAAPATVTAQAAKGNTDKFSVTKTHYLDKLQACVKVTFTAKVTYNAQHFANIPGGGATDEYRLTKIKMSDVHTGATVYYYDTGDHVCTTRKFKVKRIKLTTGVAAYSCKYNPSLSVGLPFSVGVGFWPDCGDHKAASLSTSNTNATGINIYDSDATASFGNQDVLTQGGKPSFQCYGVKSKASVLYHDTEQVYRTAPKKLCLSPTY